MGDNGRMASAERKVALQDARAAVAKAVERLEVAPVFGFDKRLYFLGTLKTYLSIFIIGRYPEYFFMWHATQVITLVPLQAYRWHKMKGLAYFIELCWISAFCIGGYLATMAVAPELVPSGARPVLFRMLFA